MLASALIIGFSLVLLVYWFRYSCALLLSSRAACGDADRRFSFGEARQRLAAQAELDTLRRSLQRDYEILIYLIEHASGLELASIEDRLLVADYKLMQWRYRLTKSLFPGQARRAVYEMASVVNVLVSRINEQAGLRSEA